MTTTPQQVTRSIITRLLSDSDPDARRSAAEDLKSSGDHRAVQALAIALSDENKGVRDAAMRTMLSQDPSAASMSVAHYIRSRDISLRNLAAKILMKLGVKAVDALLPFLRDEDKDVRKFAVDIIGAIGSEEACYFLVPLLNDSDANVVVSVLEAMGSIGSSGATEHIVRTASKAPYARAAAAEALGKIGDGSSLKALCSRFEEMEHWGTEDTVEYLALVEGMGLCASVREIALMRGALERAKGIQRRALIHAIVRTAERGGVEPNIPEYAREDLLDMMSDPDESVRMSAVTALSAWPGEDITRSFIRALGQTIDFDFLLVSHLLRRDEVFRLSVEALEAGEIRSSASVILLITKLSGEMIGSFSDMAAAFDPSLVGRAFEAARKSWEFSDVESRAVIIDAMFSLDGDLAAAHVGRLSGDPDPWLRIHVIELLGNLRGRSALDAIMRFLDDEHEMVRETAQAVLSAGGLACSPVGS